MEGIRLYQQLLQHPLFQGMSHDDLGRVIAQTKFDFRKYHPSQVIASEYAPCRHVLFLLDGTLSIQRASDNHTYSVHETAEGPWMLPITNLFGLHQHHSHTFTAATPCHVLAIDKSEVMHLSESFMIFHFNLLNILAAASQKRERHMWHPTPQTLEERILQFITARCLTPHGTKTIRIKMTHLASELNDSRLNISRALRNMQQHRLLTLHRGRIVVDCDAVEKVKSV